MNTVTHSLAHRAPPATRTRVRWQPYTAIPTPSTSSPSSTYLNSSSTPSLTSSPSSIFSNDSQRPTHSTLKPVVQLPKDTPLRDTLKNKYALNLVDQAVKSICEIWRPQDVPLVFLTSSKPTIELGNVQDINNRFSSSHRESRNTQLPSPSSPHTQQPSPLTSSCIEDAVRLQAKNTLVPIKGFVHEVLRRSRTSGCVLQTALCYLEAIRPKIPQLIQKQREGDCIWRDPDLADIIVPAIDVETQQAEPDMSLDALIDTDQCGSLTDSTSDTIKITDMIDVEAIESTAVDPTNSPGPKQNESLAPMPPLPSPLLCPRRSFLAALILASKFTQDKCYSNRAWAKLSGLSPREIGRCERALGEALEWRLWVGKAPVAPQTPTSTAPPAPRPIPRARSESSLVTVPAVRLPFLVQNETCAPVSGDRGLRRSSTLPAEAFAGGAGEQMAQALDMPPLPAEPMDEESPNSQSSTPSLVYSPTSTESSSGGDRTVAMSSFQEPMEEPNIKCPNTLSSVDHTLVQALDGYPPCSWKMDETHLLLGSVMIQI
ncbi:hypothetical protein AMATHDRAFT_1027 [Amanita thiersii Skay4041]|uniref:Cyclin N-terminal domain-containing protein n=1 Tax=Amanita thiersii Skay4041 TaxID=703135 RepID=A0A2A9NZ08_9AGAR|nr:hypothetical protein AMATHDRAFT_1027 [Amanita thiersii Skay4041]